MWLTVASFLSLLRIFFRVVFHCDAEQRIILCILSIVNHMTVSFDNHDSFHTDNNDLVDNDANAIFCDRATNFSKYNKINFPYYDLDVEVDCAGDNPEVVCDCCDCKWSG